MKRKLLIFAAAAVLVLGAAALLLFHRPEAPAPLSPGVEAREISIRNVTAEDVEYEVVEAEGGGPGKRMIVKPGGIHRLQASRPLDISFPRSGRTVSHRLFPGKPYSFRYDSDDLLEIYEGSHGWQEVEDLAPFVPTPMEVVDRMLELADLGEDDVLYDLGCGDGRIVITAARKYGARGVGVDIDPARIRESRTGARRAGVRSRVEFHEADAMKVDISRAAVVTLYLLPESNALLRPKFEKELEPGTLVISHNYHIPGWEDKEVRSEVVKDADGKDHTLFVYRR
ncbi:MAG: methyltransferase domain-containing protein [Candidatus Aminicenantes bacterium]|nr:methyltransferase domain-containing protein [Candidatus Aminicenantes bacterium]